MGKGISIVEVIADAVKSKPQSLALFVCTPF